MDIIRIPIKIILVVWISDKSAMLAKNKANVLNVHVFIFDKQEVKYTVSVISYEANNITKSLYFM